MIETPNNWLKTIYLSKKLSVETDEDDNEYITYDTPIKLMANHQPVNGSSDIQTYGERITQMQRAMFDSPEYDNTFEEFDLAYLDGANPLSELYNGSNANYRIVSVRKQNRAIVVYFEKIVGR